MTNGGFDLVDLTRPDVARIAELVDRYEDLPLGTTDASVIALAERLGAAEIATLDHRHFRVVRPSHVGAFTLLPAFVSWTSLMVRSSPEAYDHAVTR